MELFHRTLDIDDHSMLWLIRAVASACVDIKALKRLSPVGKPECSEEGCNGFCVRTNDIFPGPGQCYPLHDVASACGHQEA